MKTVRSGNWWPTPLVGCAGAGLATLLGWPLPWIVGPTLMVTLVRCAGWRVTEVPGGRISGQWLIATAIGLHFTPGVMGDMLAYLPMMLLASVLTLLLALLGIGGLRWRGMPLATAYFAFMPANFAEMIQLGARYQADVGRVAAAHGIRLLLIVFCVPSLFILGVPGPVPVPEPGPPSGWRELLPLLAGGGLSALLWRRLGLPNAWMFGPLLFCAGITLALGHALSLPGWLSHYAQLMLGCALGGHFDRPFFRSAPRFLLLSALFTLALVAGTLAVALGVSLLFEVPARVLALGMMPGSSTEMYLTAEALSLAVGLVTAMQIMRLVLVMLCAQPLYLLWEAVARRLR